MPQLMKTRHSCPITVKLGGKTIEKMPGSKCLAELGAQVLAKCHSVAVPSSREGGRQDKGTLAKTDIKPIYSAFKM